MKSLKKIMLCITLLSTSVHAVPAFQGELTFKQADGTLFKGHLRGDEFFHWAELNNKSVIFFNKKSKNYEYAKIVQDDLGKNTLKASGMKAQEGKINPFLVNRKKLFNIWKEKRILRMQRMHKPQ